MELAAILAILVMRYIPKIVCSVNIDLRLDA